VSTAGNRRSAGYSSRNASVGCTASPRRAGPIAAARGKDPGFSPSSLLELLRRRGRIRPEDLARLHLAEPVDPQALKSDWLAALGGAEAFVRDRSPEEVGCLYYSPELKRFVDPDRPDVGRVVPHFGRPGGVVPRIIEDEARFTPAE
jgi:hypothetical protein